MFRMMNPIYCLADVILLFLRFEKVVKKFDEFVEIPKDAMEKMNWNELKEELRIRGLKLSGRKGDMFDRLSKAMVDKVKVVGDSKTSATKNKNQRRRRMVQRRTKVWDALLKVPIGKF